MEFYQSDTTTLRRDGCESRLSSHHELDTLTNHSTTIALFRVDVERSARSPRSPLGRLILTLVRLSTLPRVSRYLSLIAPAHSHSAPLTYLNKTSKSIATMTSGSIGTYYFDVGPVGEHTEKKTSDITGFHIFLWCKFQLFL